MADQGAADEATGTDEPGAPEPPAERYGAPVTWSRGQEVLHAHADASHDVLRRAHEDAFISCVDLTAVDYLTYGERARPEGRVASRPGAVGGAPAELPDFGVLPVSREVPDGIVAERFEVVVNLFRHHDRSRLRLRVQVPEDEPSLPTTTDLWFGTDAMEREVYDMFGITFEGHPDLTRILMPEDWVGHPLRKDFNSGRIPVQFKGDPAGQR